MSERWVDRKRAELDETGSCCLGFSVTLTDATDVADGLDHDKLLLEYTRNDDGIWLEAVPPKAA